MWHLFVMCIVLSTEFNARLVVYSKLFMIAHDLLLLLNYVLLRTLLNFPKNPKHGY